MPFNAATVFMRKDSYPHITTLIALAAVSSLALNMFLPSLPSMTGYFETDYSVMQLSVGLFLIMNSVLQIVLGPISDRYGRRPVVVFGVIGFIIASVGCALAQSVEVFLIFRMLQAVIAVGLTIGRAAIRDMVGPQESASMIGYVTMAMSVVPMIAPAIGGELDGALGWQANFWFMACAGVAILIIVWFDFGETSTHRASSFTEQFAHYPELFKSRRFWGYTFAMMFSVGTFFAYLGGGPFVGSDVFNLTPEVFGYYFGAPALGYFLGNFVTGRVAKSVELNVILLWGSLITLAGMCAGTLLFAAGAQTPVVFFGCMSFIGLGNGLILPSGMAGLMSVRPHLAGTASGVAGAIMTAGGASLSAYAGALLGPTTGAMPLLTLMLACAALCVLMILYVIVTERST